MNRSREVVLSVAVLVVGLLLVAARPALARDEWLPVSHEDLALKDNPKSPGANAMILYRESVVDSKFLKTDGVAVREYVRIKIFTKEGTKEGDVEIPFYKAENEESQRYGVSFGIVDVRGRTIRPDGSIVQFDGKVFEKTSLKQGGMKFLVKAFTLPDVQPGCIIEYKYRKQYPPYWLPAQEWVVQSELFTREAHFTMLPFLGDGYRLIYRYSGLSEGQIPQGQPNGDFKMDVRDVPGIEDEPEMPPERTLQGRVQFFYREPGEPGTEAPEHYWDRIGKKWCGELEHFTSKKNALDGVVSKVVGPADSPEMKLRKIYARVQQVRNLDMEDYKTKLEEKQESLKSNSNVEDVLKHGYAKSREINYLFVGLARAAGFDATETYVVPRNEDIFQPRMEDSSQLQADIVWVKAGTQEYYLDPAARYFPFGVLPWYETAAQGIRVTKQGGTMTVTPPPLSTLATVVRQADLEINEDGSVSGKLQIDFTGQRGALLREENRKQDETGRKKALEEETHAWLPAGSTFAITKIENWDDNTVPVHIEGTVKVPGLGTSVGKRMLVPATIFQSPETKTFQSEKRTNAVYFHFLFEEIDDVKIKAPAGYKVESVPPAVPPTPAVITYELTAAQQGDAVEVKRHLVENGIVFDVKYYPALRAFFNRVKSNDDAQVVFQKSDSSKGN